MKRRWLLVAVLLLMIPITCHATENGGYIRLKMSYDGHVVSGGSVTLYDVSDSPEGTGPLEMLVYVKELDITGQEKQVGETGVVTFENLPEGRFLLVQHKAAPGYYPIKPFLIRLPQTAEGAMGNGIDAAPKLEPEKKLPQTGQLIWPAWVFLGCGTVFVGIGLLGRKRR